MLHHLQPPAGSQYTTPLPDDGVDGVHVAHGQRGGDRVGGAVVPRERLGAHRVRCMHSPMLPVPRAGRWRPGTGAPWPPRSGRWKGERLVYRTTTRGGRGVGRPSVRHLGGLHRGAAALTWGAELQAPLTTHVTRRTPAPITTTAIALPSSKSPGTTSRLAPEVPPPSSSSNATSSESARWLASPPHGAGPHRRPAHRHGPRQACSCRRPSRERGEPHPAKSLGVSRASVYRRLTAATTSSTATVASGSAQQLRPVTLAPPRSVAAGVAAAPADSNWCWRYGHRAGRRV